MYSCSDLDTFSIYLQKIGQFPRLSPEQEIIYGRQVQEMISLSKSLDALSFQLHRQATIAELAVHINKTETQIVQIRKDGQQAKYKMITANLRLVVAVAKKYQWSNIELIDLVQEGAIGLQNGVEKFDPNRGYKFGTYVYWWIRQEIGRAVMSKSHTVRLPRHLWEKLPQIRKAVRQLFQKLGRPPTAMEIAQAAQLPLELIREYLSKAQVPVSLDIQVGAEQESQFKDLLPSECISPLEYASQEHFDQDLINALESLTPVQRDVLMMRFGIGGESKQTVEQVAQKLNLNISNVKYTQQRALHTLSTKQGHIRDYLAS